ncbi:MULTISPECIES: hypothetical protein [Halorussus]|uniref:hypothetical protein n=1 Tax=Halorussus TaxID=1070314 RepID=UPI00209D81AD|nr:hypothetical protein [Halorussus vallis]USZ74040.1 hypothetical protein NGM07_11290 [Halorussus vallis]
MYHGRPDDVDARIDALVKSGSDPDDERAVEDDEDEDEDSGSRSHSTHHPLGNSIWWDREA